MLKLFSKKPKEPVRITKTICEKHGEVPNYNIRVQGKEYAACWHCIGEMSSQYTRTETYESD